MIMRISMANQLQVTPPPSLEIPTGGGGRLRSDLFIQRRHKEKVLILMGATGTGKSRLSVDLATRFPAEIINSDKLQMYQGLDIVTNKITLEEQCGVPHHLLGTQTPNSDFTSTDFCNLASLHIKSTLSRDRLPIIVGGSNSYIEALYDYRLRSKYHCCFLWVDVSMPVLHSFVSERVDKMVHNGLIDEVRSIFDPNNRDYSKGIRKAIGVPELDMYFRAEPFLNEENRKKLLRDAIQEIKKNTCKLACRQSEKIHRLRNVKAWNIHRVDATQVFRNRGNPKAADHAWDKFVAGPSTGLVAEFLYDNLNVANITDHIITNCLVA